MTGEDLPIRERLILAAAEMFGRLGYDATSTRDLAAAAGATMSAITYHFEGKEGLLLAVAGDVADRVSERLTPMLQTVRARLDLADGPSPKEAADDILAMIDIFVSTMLLKETAVYARFIVREQMSPSPAFEILFARYLGPVLDTLACLLVRLAPRSVDLDEARRISVTLLGQVTILQSARATVSRALGWPDTGPSSQSEIRATVAKSTRLIINGLRRGEKK